MKILLALLMVTSPLLGVTTKTKSEKEKIQNLSNSCGEFGFSLYNVLNTPNSPNLLFSPYSIFSCLSMTWIGARDLTAAELSKALHLSYDRTDLPGIATILANYLTVNVNEAYTLDIANGLWLGPDTFVLADYRHAIEKGYKAHVQILDFSNPATATSTINAWIDTQTRHKIPTLLQERDVDPSTRMVLTNAVYFQGKWQRPFDPKMTKEADFHPDRESSLTVDMMEQVSTFAYMDNESFQLLALPFAKKEERSSLACLILLPKKEKALATVEKMLSQTALSGWIDAFHPESVRVKIPKFCINFRTDLNDPLQQLGVQKAFSLQANFSGINGVRDLYLNKVVHEAFFSLDEVGVVAAAATGASMNMMATPPTAPIRTFVADRPFLFILVDLTAKLPLFIGKLQDPTNVR